MRKAGVRRTLSQWCSNSVGKVQGFPSAWASEFQTIFTARCYASAVLAIWPCVCLSVCPSQVGVLLKRLNVGSDEQHHTIVQRDSSFLMPKISAKFDRGHPLRGRQMQVGWVKIGDFRQITGFILKSNKKSYALYRMVTLPINLSAGLKCPKLPQFVHFAPLRSHIFVMSVVRNNSNLVCRLGP